MIDTLEKHLPHAPFDRVRDRFAIREREYAVVTLHRPSNVDHPDTLAGIVAALDQIADRMTVVFPVHPRTRDRLAGNRSSSNGLVLTEPLGYLDFLSLTSHARIVLTDSGGLQEESTALGIPCLTLRENTERPVTVTHGTNEIVGASTERILAGFARSLSRTAPATRPELWDGRTAERIADAIRSFLGIEIDSQP